MAKKKIKIPASRVAIFDKWGTRDEDREKLHMQANQIASDPTNPHHKHFLSIGVDPNGTDEEVGNRIIEKHYEREQERKAKFAAMIATRDRLASPFQQTFKTSLQRFMNPFTGFDVIAFDDVVVKSGDLAMSDVVRDRWGERAVKIIEELIGKPTDQEPQCPPNASLNPTSPETATST